jgi:uncharacterized OB-fold protein
MSDVKAQTRKSIPIREGIFEVPPHGDETRYLMGNRCKKCSQVSFPPREICSRCYSEAFDRIRLSTKGKLYSFTLIGYPPPGLTAPYAIGYVDLPEGIRIFSILSDWDRVGLKIGMELELIFGRFKEDKDGNEIFTYKFRPSSG